MPQMWRQILGRRSKMTDQDPLKLDDMAMTFIIGAATSLLIEKVLGGIKMFGDEKTPQKLAEEMMAGAVRGILEHFEFKMDEMKRDIERKAEKIGELEDKLEVFEAAAEKEKAAKL
jgi:hypothetical protein